ncbi:MAG: LCP family protein [candidate division WOR-3 bacterium]
MATRETLRPSGIALIPLLVILVAMALAVAVILLLVQGTGRQPPLISLVLPPPVKSDLGDTFNILLTGRDARIVGDKSFDGKRRNRREDVYHSDIIIVAHVNLPLRRVVLVNIPRDMLVPIPGVSHSSDRTDFCNLDKITHASAYGKEALLVRTIEANLGIRINRRAALDFDSFRLGYDLVRPLLGRLSLRGRSLGTADSALLFVRARRAWINDDIDRSRHSLLFIKAVVQRLWSKLSAPAQQIVLPRVLNLLGNDTDLSSGDIRYVIRELKARRFNPDSIELAVLVGNPSPVTLWDYGQTLSCYLPAWNVIERQVDHFLRDRLDIAAPTFMEQDQKIRWPGYVFADYDLLAKLAPSDSLDTLRLAAIQQIESLARINPHVRHISESLRLTPTTGPDTAPTSGLAQDSAPPTPLPGSDRHPTQARPPAAGSGTSSHR